MKPSLFGLSYLIDYHVRRKSRPLTRGLVLTNRCNLRCRHCRVRDRGEKDLSFGEVRAAIHAFYEEGGRCLYLEGGEPFLWHDGDYRLDDVVNYAHAHGFINVVVYTNGTFPLATSADTVFISVDGLQTTHDRLRGKTFDGIMGRIRDSAHRSLYINFTINMLNRDEIEPFCEYVNRVANIRGVFFYFHTPYYGYDELYLEPGEKNQILRRLLEGKRRFKILNSRAGLRSAMRNDWRRPLGICSVYEKGVVYPCCRYSGDARLCLQCGYLSYAEIDQTLKLRPSAIWNALKYFGAKPGGDRARGSGDIALRPAPTPASEAENGCCGCGPGEE
jgi:Fe-coproporphyrin III synthase